MTWFPPHIEHYRSTSPLRSLLLLAISGSLCGCTSLPSMRSMSVANSLQTAPAAKGDMPPAVPDFDIAQESPVEKVAAAAAAAVLERCGQG